MRGCLIAMGSDPGDLGLEQADALGQIVLRIAVQALAGELARGAKGLPGGAARKGKFVVHCNATLGALRFVSTVCITAGVSAGQGWRSRAWRKRAGRQDNRTG